MTKFKEIELLREFVNPDTDQREYVIADWRGSELSIGSSVVYPRMSGRSVELSDGEVTDIWLVFRDTEYWRWNRFEGGGTEEFMARNDFEWRIKIQPEKSSRGFWRGNSANWNGHWNEDHTVWVAATPTKLSQVVLTNIENVTVIGE